ncbi:MAG: hypothetical protein AAFY29_09470 [Pseudomonadota bacterium]
MKEFLSSAVALLLTCGLLLDSVANSAAEQSIEELTLAADNVVEQIGVDNVQAAKNVDLVFLAADRWARDRNFVKARHYFEAGLQLSPWDMAQQLAYAQVLSEQGDTQRASSVASLVAKTTETTNLLRDARKLASIPTAGEVPPLPSGPLDQPVILFIRVGDVADWILESTGDRLTNTLGTPVYLSDTIIPLPRNHRSFYQRWAEKLKDGLVWDHPYVQQQMRSLSIESRAAATVDETLELLARITVAQGQDDPRPSFPALKQQVQAQDQQWDADQLLTDIQELSPDRDNVTVIGVTQADIYSGDSNFVFGLAHIGTGRALVSTKRFEAQFNRERENQQRFLDRLHKQLLSSIGFAFGIPRPTDPRSARSYPSGLADHDLKGTWLAREDLEAFEQFLGHKLPESTWGASRQNW